VTERFDERPAAPLGATGRDRILREALATGVGPVHLTLVFTIDQTNVMAYADTARSLLGGRPNRHCYPAPGIAGHPAPGMSPRRPCPIARMSGMRIDPDPAGSELDVPSQYFDYQR
jgi:hypothetical protein